MSLVLLDSKRHCGFFLGSLPCPSSFILREANGYIMSGPMEMLMQ